MTCAFSPLVADVLQLSFEKLGQQAPMFVCFGRQFVFPGKRIGWKTTYLVVDPNKSTAKLLRCLFHINLQGPHLVFHGQGYAVESACIPLPEATAPRLREHSSLGTTGSRSVTTLARRR